MSYINDPRLIAEQMATTGVDPDAAKTDSVMLREAIEAEYDAINLYEQMANTTKNERVKKALLDIAREEKVHVGELEKLLTEVDKEHAEAVGEGAKEVG